MMMAHDTGSMPPNALAPETVEAVRGALQRYADSATSAEAAPGLHEALHALAREARAKEVPPEQLLIVLKGIWNGLPEVRSLKHGPDRVLILQRIVTMCIKE